MVGHSPGGGGRGGGGKKELGNEDMEPAKQTSKYVVPMTAHNILSTYQNATGWIVRGLNPGGARFSAHPDRPWGPPSLLYNGY